MLSHVIPVSSHFAMWNKNYPMVGILFSNYACPCIPRFIRDIQYFGHISPFINLPCWYFYVLFARFLTCHIVKCVVGTSKDGDVIIHRLLILKTEENCVQIISKQRKCKKR